MVLYIDQQSTCHVPNLGQMQNKFYFYSMSAGNQTLHMKSLLQISFAQKQKSSWRAITSRPGYPHNIHRRCNVASLLWPGRCHVTRQCSVHMLRVQVSLHLTTRKTHDNNHKLVDCCFLLLLCGNPCCHGLLGLFAHAKIMLIDLIDQLMRPCKSPVSSLRSLLLVALAIRHEILRCNFHHCWTCKSSSWTVLWSNMLSSITIIVAINCVIVCCYLHCDRTSGRQSWSSSWSIVQSFVAIFITIKLACLRYHHDQICCSQW